MGTLQGRRHARSPTSPAYVKMENTSYLRCRHWQCTTDEQSLRPAFTGQLSTLSLRPPACANLSSVVVPRPVTIVTDRA